MLLCQWLLFSLLYQHCYYSQPIYWHVKKSGWTVIVCPLFCQIDILCWFMYEYFLYSIWSSFTKTLQRMDLIYVISAACFNISLYPGKVLCRFFWFKLSRYFHMGFYSTQPPFWKIIGGRQGKVFYPKKIISSVFLYPFQKGFLKTLMWDGRSGNGNPQVGANLDLKI